MFALVLPIALAVKLATVTLLSLLPIGLAVYCRALKKSPTMGVAAGFLVWGTLTHWGFISFLGALGLSLMGTGVAFMVVGGRRAGEAVALGVIGVLLFFTHIAEVPPFLAALALVTAVMAPISTGSRAVIVAALPTAALFLLVVGVRATPLSAELGAHPRSWTHRPGPVLVVPRLPRRRRGVDVVLDARDRGWRCRRIRW